MLPVLKYESPAFKNTTSHKDDSITKTQLSVNTLFQPSVFDGQSSPNFIKKNLYYNKRASMINDRSIHGLYSVISNKGEG